jgi:hypothetical protein
LPSTPLSTIGSFGFSRARRPASASRVSLPVRTMIPVSFSKAVTSALLNRCSSGRNRRFANRLASLPSKWPLRTKTREISADERVVNNGRRVEVKFGVMCRNFKVARGRCRLTVGIARQTSLNELGFQPGAPERVPSVRLNCRNDVIGRPVPPTIEQHHLASVRLLARFATYRYFQAQLCRKRGSDAIAFARQPRGRDPLKSTMPPHRLADGGRGDGCGRAVPQTRR